MTTTYPTRVSTLEAMLAVSLPGVEITPDHDYGDPGQCEWCGLAGALGTVRVYGEAPEDSREYGPIELVEICRKCAPEVILRAVAEQDEQSRKPIRVEVEA